MKIQQVKSKYRTNNFFGLLDSYSVYKKLDISKKVKKSLYLMIVKDFMLFLRNSLIKTGEVVLPQKCGTVSITGHPTKVKLEDGKIKNRIDWGETNKLWARDPVAKQNKQLVYHFNEKTNGYFYQITWSKHKVPLRNKNNYVFIRCRALRRLTSAAITNQTEYIIKP